MRIRDIARIGGFPCGEYNAVTDVKGVRAMSLILMTRFLAAS